MNKDGTISGTPTATGIFAFTVEATIDGAVGEGPLSNTQQLSITIRKAVFVAPQNLSLASDDDGAEAPGDSDGSPATGDAGAAWPWVAGGLFALVLAVGAGLRRKE